ncbi:MAG TPA: serine/threonine-protein kinase [Enhygromyxa sp.]|nr:serine/threonine-protein kinase [Enhygromyxa sp.]
MTHGSDTVLRELSSGFQIEHASGKLQVHELAPGVILQEYEAGVVDEFFSPVVELAQRRIDEGLRVTLVSDITRSRSHTTSYRRAWIDWIREHDEHIDEVLVLMASPMHRMAVNAASKATGERKFRAFTDVEEFQAAVEQAVLRAETAAANVERLSPVLLRTGSGPEPGEPRVTTVALVHSPAGTLESDDDHAEGSRRQSPRAPKRLASSQPQLGTVLADAYRLDARIGKGGMGMVYRARQLSLDRDVAIKLIRLDRRHNPDTFARFRREIDVVSRLSHPNVVQVIDAGATDDGISYLVMELLIGRRLDQLVGDTVARDKRALDPKLAVELFGQVCAGVGAAHAAGLVHRDLSPANVFVRELDGTTQIKILDFGLAKAPERGEMALTLDGQILGTPGFMAPEQIDQERPADVRTDVYALGVLFYYMLTGRRPFGGKSSASIIAKQLEGKYAPLEHPNQRYALVIDKALARNPDDRYPSVAALWAAVQKASQPSERERSSKRLTAWAWGLALALMLAGVVGVVAHSCARESEGEDYIDPPQPP